MLAGAIMVPHPPVALPEVGHGREQQMERTEEGYRAAAEFAAACHPDTLIILSPHAVMYRDWFNVSSGNRAYGDMGQFRAGNVAFDVPYDTEFIHQLDHLMHTNHFPAGTDYDRDRMLDHGTMVPLYFLNKEIGHQLPIVRIGLSGLSLVQHYRFGMYLRQVIDASEKQYFIVASGDLSHCQKEDGPYGYRPEGPQYDVRIMRTMASGNFGELLSYEPAFLSRAQECGHRSFTILAGVLDRTAVECTRISHEAPFGVGYGICTYRPLGYDASRSFLEQYEAQEEKKNVKISSDPYAALARKTISLYVKTGKILSLPQSLPQEMYCARHGVFVSIHEFGELRGCIGTIHPVQKNVGLEIIHNAISACARDPRFEPVTAQELPYLTVSVDELSEPETVALDYRFNVKKDGILVSKDSRRGVLLPDLEGVDTPQQQFSIACRKAGISPSEAGIVRQRFEVIRHV